MSYVDLHIHTTCSDGTDTPEEVVTLALTTGLTTIAITDHDTVSGIAAAQRAAQGKNLTVLGGIEVSTGYLGRDIHLLGYLMDPTHPALTPVLDWVVTDRDNRNRRIAQLLCRDGFAIDLALIQGSHPDTVIGRPHLAQALLQGGYVQSIQQAFDLYLAEGRPYYLSRSYIPLEQAISLIRRAGGVPVLAHPLQYGFSDSELEQLVLTAKTAGVLGLEVYYSGYGPEQLQQLLSLAARHNLMVTGGSDYHGTRKPHITLGRGTGDLQVPESVASALLKTHADLKNPAPAM